MKTKTPSKITVLSAGVLLAAIAVTMGPPSVFASAESVSRSPAVQEDELPPGDLVALERFLTMSDEELDRLQAALARIRAMSEDERQQFAEHVVEYRRLPRAERQRAREGWGWQDQRDREDWRRMMQDLTPAERRNVHESLQDLSPKDRVQRRLELIEQWRETDGGMRRS